MLALAGCVRDEQPATTLMGDSTGTQTPQPPGSSPPSTTPPTTTPPADNPPTPVDPTTPTTTPPTTDVAAFQQTLYPHLRDPQNLCVGCHGATQIPTFAVADVMTAYNVITTQQKVDLVNPQLSRVYLRPAVDRHNCGGNAACDAIAADFLAAIQQWAQLRPAPPPPTQQALMSAVTSFSQGMGSSNGRADANAVAVFTFDEGAGTTTTDKAGQITLQITGMDWVQGGLKNVSGKAQANATDSRKLFDAINPAGQFSVEAWIIPDNLTQTGPARIVSYSSGTATRNFMLGQNTTDYRGRARTSVSNANGDPQLDGANPDVATALQHVVLTFDPAVGRKLYVNGQLSAQENAPATLAWTNDQTFVIGNETSNDRLWMGTFELVAIHKKALSAAEVQQNFAAGAGGLVTLSFDVSSIVGAQARVDLLAARSTRRATCSRNRRSSARPTRASRTSASPSTMPCRWRRRRSGASTRRRPRRASSSRRSAPWCRPRWARHGQVPPRVRGARDEGRARGDGAALLAARAGAGRAGARARRRSFSQIDATMSALTGVSIGATAVQTLYTDVRDSLPTTANLLAFGASQQLAIQRLATTYCGEVVANATTCSGFFGACTIAAGAQGQSPTPSSTSCSARTLRTSRTKRPRTPSS